MVKTSSITDYEASRRLNSMRLTSNTLYYYMQEQDYDIWLAWCDADAALNKLYGMIERMIDKKERGEGKLNDR